MSTTTASDRKVLAALAASAEATPLDKRAGKPPLAAAAERAAREHDGGSFALTNLSSVLEQYHLWQTTMPGVEPYYPVKVNPDRQILKLVAAIGGGFDVASEHEIREVLAVGAQPAKLIFSHTVKMEKDMRAARELGVKFSIVDSVEEVEKHKRAWPEAKLLLRIAPQRKDWDLGHKFGVEKLRAARAGRAALPESGAESKHAVDVGRGHLGVHCCWQTPKIIMGHTPRPQQLCDLFHSSPSRILPG